MCLPSSDPVHSVQQSEISDELIAAYRSANYRVGTGENAFTLRIDQQSEPLSRLFVASGWRCAAFITACNPFGKLQSLEENDAACTRLLGRLRRYVELQDRVIEGAGCDPSGKWPAETSFLALGLDFEIAWTLGREFGQNAIVWCGADAIPRLILLR